jgi:hypothetical protein
MDADQILAGHAAEHHGVFRGSHARMAGLTKRQIASRIANHRWDVLHHDVYRINGAPRLWEGDLLAACWAGGFRAVASHCSGAELYVLPGRSRDLLEITCPRWRRARHVGLVVHETSVLDGVDVTIVDGIPCTTPARTVFDLCGRFRLGMSELVLESALRQDLVTTREMWATLDRLSRSGRPGGTNLRLLLQERDPRQRVTHSEMEVRLLQVVRDWGLPVPSLQYEVWDGGLFVGQVDAAYPEARIAIEYDSDQFHTGHLATKRDRDRRHRLIAAGWLPVDVGPEQLRRSEQLCTSLAKALQTRSRHAS